MYRRISRTFFELDVVLTGERELGEGGRYRLIISGGEETQVLGTFSDREDLDRFTMQAIGSVQRSISERQPQQG